MSERTHDEPDWEEDILIPPFEIPEFKPYIKPDDLDGLEERDRRVLLAMSVIEQKLDFALRRHQEISSHQRFIVRELGRVRRAQREVSRGFTLGKAIAVTLGAGLSAELLHILLKQIVP
jgi:hypothetical protein